MDTAKATFDRPAAADRYRFNIPMWNNGIPYALKWWIDEHGYAGMMMGKKAAIVYASGTFAQSRGPEFGRDFHSTYFEDWLNLIGITDFTRTRFQLTVLSPTLTEQRLVASQWSVEAGAGFN